MFCVPNQLKLFFDNRRSSEEVLIGKDCLLNKLQVNCKFSRIKKNIFKIRVRFYTDLSLQFLVCHKKTTFLFINNQASVKTFLSVFMVVNYISEKKKKKKNCQNSAIFLLFFLFYFILLYSTKGKNQAICIALLNIFIILFCYVASKDQSE